MFDLKIGAAASTDGAGIEATMMPIAIIGIGCRFPGKADTVDGFWRVLVNAVDATSTVPKDRWNSARLYSPTPTNDPGTVGSPRGGFVHDMAEFDAGFFGISPREAAVMDPQQRMLLEAAFNALENGGQTLEKLRGRDVGVFVGIASFDYAEIQHSTHDREYIGVHTNTGTALSIAANRISYLFDFKGPSMAVDSACSSSLVAVHLACRSLAMGECTEALVGGANAILKPESTIGFSCASMLAPDGRCKTFDARANGYTRGEGAGVVVLKPLSAALRDRDPIYAVIRGTSVNQDGHTTSMTIPSDVAQAAMLRTAYRRAGIDPSEVQYMEAHGTGTPVGDPIEVRALGEVLGANRSPEAPCYIGSVKTNIGHLEAAAGIAGLIKAALCVHHGTIPATLNFRPANPALTLDDSYFAVPTKSVPWPKDGRPRRAGVNSFGFGGTNAHVVIEEAPAAAATPERADPPADEPALAPRVTPPFILPMSARGEAALLDLSRLHVSALHQGEGLIAVPDYCRAASRRRTHHHYRLAVVGKGRTDFIEKINDYNGGLEPAGLIHGVASAIEKPEDRPVFVFSGMGPQWWGMGRELMASEPLFRHWIERSDEALSRYADWSLVEEMSRDEAASRMGETQISQPANFALQVGLAALWRSWGIEPSAIVGHSAGEVAAGFVSGMLAFEDAVRVIYHRSHLQHRTSGAGKMVAAGIGKERAEAEIERYRGRVSVAAVNGPSSVTLSGDAEPLAEIVEQLGQEGLFTRVLTVDVPFHSHHMEPLKDDLHAALDGLPWQPAMVPLYSTVTVARAKGFGYDGAYWWRNVRDPVLFAAAIDALVADGHRTFLEISPHPVLSSLVSESLGRGRAKGKVFYSLLRKHAERETLLTTLAELYVQGQAVDWAGVYPGENTPVVLPEYPWRREFFWLESPDAKARRLLPLSHPLLGTRADHPEPSWLGDLSLRIHSYMDDHRVRGSAIFPAAGYVEIALAAGREVHGTASLRLENLSFENALVLKAGEAIEARVGLSSATGAIALHSRVAGDPEAAWLAHMQGQVREIAIDDSPRFDLGALHEICHEDISSRCYPTFANCGLDYGPSFQGVDTLWRGDGQALAALRPLDQLIYGEDADDLDRYVLHPSLLDACFQVLIGTLIGKEGEALPTYLPVGLEEMRVHGVPDSSERYYVHVRQTLRSRERLEGDIFLLDGDGRVLAEIRKFSCKALKAGSEKNELDTCLYAFDWESQDIALAGGVALADIIAPPALAEAVRPGLKDLAERFRRERYYGEIEPMLDTLTATYTWEAFKELGAIWKAGDVLTTDGVCLALKIAVGHQRLTARLLACLATLGYLRALEPDRWEVVALPEGQVASAIGATCLARYKEMESELTMIERCGRHLAAVLRGKQDPVQVMFPDGNQSLTEPVYALSSSFGTYNEIVERTVRALIAKLPEDRAIRILEIGAGTGALATRLLQFLPADRVRYVYTDVSSAFLVRAESKFAEFPGVEYRVLDIEKSPVVQGFEPGSFDLVLAGDVLHATRDLKLTVDHATSLLAPGGYLLLLELTSPPYWFDLTFGQLKGWWAFEDLDRRAHHCCVGREVWHALLTEVGQEDISVLTDRADPDAPSVHSIILSSRTEAAANAVDHADDGVWVLMMDQAGIGARLKTEFERNGYEVAPVVLVDGHRPRPEAPETLTIAFGDRPAMQRTLSDLSAAYGGIAGVVYLRALDAPAIEAAETAALDAYATRDCLNVLDLVKTLDAMTLATPPRLVLATRDLQQVVGADAIGGILGAPLWGFGRVVTNEYPAFEVALVDLPAVPADEDIAGLYREATLRTQREAEVALRGGARYVARLQQMSREQLERAQSRLRPVPEGTPFHLDVFKRGSLDNFVLRQGIRRAPGEGEIEIDVHNGGLNFRDLMKAMDIYPTEGDEVFHLGDECSGMVSRVGPGATGFAVGDRVAAVARGFSSSLVVPANFAARIPDHVSFRDAATLPIAFLTAWYALRELARIQPGERVLIHAAAGGVGLAAVQIAHAVGAEVFATASSEDKRAHLSAMGVKHIMNSRSLDFHDEILAATNGEGVDIVLNSLAGEFIPKSLKLLRAYGRFLEIGKADIYQNRSLGLLPFRRNLSYFAIDLDRMFKERPAWVRALLGEVMRAFEKGMLKPLPVTAFDIADAQQAFRFMAQAKHIGKIVFDVRGAERQAVRRRPEGATLRKDGSYLLVGGLGGFGTAVAEWMTRQGARHLYLCGRRTTVDADLKARLAAIEGAGATVHVVGLDMTDEAMLAGVLERIGREAPPLKGVVHMAMVLNDGFIKDQDADSFRKVIDPKVKGAWHLHRLTRNLDLDLFVMFSSFAAVVGNPGQSNYVAANQFLDALAQHRQALGLPAFAIDWGPIAEVGYVSKHDDIMRHFDRHGLTAFPPEEAMRVLEAGLKCQLTSACAIRIDWEAWAKYMPELVGSSRFRHLLTRSAAKEAGGGGQVLSELQEATAGARPALVEAWLIRQLADVLACDASRIDASRPLAEIGVDSLISVELACLIQEGVGVDIASMEFAQAGSVTKLADRVLDRLALDEPEIIASKAA